MRWVGGVGGRVRLKGLVEARCVTRTRYLLAAAHGEPDVGVVAHAVRSKGGKHRPVDLVARVHVFEIQHAC